MHFNLIDEVHIDNWSLSVGQFFEQHMPITCPSHAHHMDTTWPAHDHPMDITWTAHEQHMTITWTSHEQHMTSTWPACVYYLPCLDHSSALALQLVSVPLDGSHTNLLCQQHYSTNPTTQSTLFGQLMYVVHITSQHLPENPGWALLIMGS